MSPDERLRGGSYEKVHELAQQSEPSHQLSDGTRIECHHLIARAVLVALGTNSDLAPAIPLTASHHRLTETYGSTIAASNARAAYLRTIRAGRIDVAIKRAEEEIKKIGPEYDEALK